MKRIFIILWIFWLWLSAFSEVLELKNNKELVSNKLIYKKNKFLIGKKAISRDKVKKVYFVKNIVLNGKDKTKKESIPIDGKHSDDKFVGKFPFELEDPKTLFDDVEKLKEKYPGISHIVIRDCGVHKLFKDGKRSYIYHGAYIVLKESAISSTKNISWSKDRDKNKFLLVRVIYPDGSIAYAKSSDIKVKDPVSKGADFINQNKIISVSLPRVKIGSIIEYAFEIFTFNPFHKEFFFPRFGFEDYVPVRLSKFEVIVPVEKDFYWVTSNMNDNEKEPEIWEDDMEFKHYMWKVENSIPIINEPSMPPYFEIAKHVRGSLFKSWDPFWEWEKRLSIDRMKVTPLIEKQTKEIVKGAKNKEEMLARIYHWIQQNIRYISIKSGIASGMAGHPAETTLKNKFGDCIDKATLMATMLKVVGIEAYPVGLMTKPGPALDIRIPHFGFNHAINVVYLDGKRITLDSTSTTHRYPSFRADDHGVWIDNYFKSEFYKTPIPHPKENAYRRYQIIKINKDGSAKVYYKTKYTGRYEAGARGYWMYKRQDMWEDELKRMINRSYPGSTLISYKINNVFDISRQFSRELYWKSPKVLQKAGKYRIIDFNLSTYFAGTSLKERKYPIVYDTSDMESYDYVVLLPDNLKVASLPENIHIYNKFGFFVQEFYKTKHGFIMRLSYGRSVDKIEVEDYKEYREFTKKIEDYFKRVVFLKEKE